MAHIATADVEPTHSQLLGLLWEHAEELVEGAAGEVELKQWRGTPWHPGEAELTLVIRLGDIREALVVATVKERIQFRVEPTEE